MALLLYAAVCSIFEPFGESDWSTPDGVVSSGRFGGDGGSEFHVDIDPGDHLIDVFGTVNVHNGSLRVASLKFVTKNGKVTEVGTESEYQFTYPSPPGYQVISIFGRAGEPPGGEVDALGFTFEPLTT